ncbi:hypothetical protein SK128_026494, partial [Halocaridina rubra]
MLPHAAILLVILLGSSQSTMITTRNNRPTGLCTPPHIQHGMVVPLEEKYKVGAEVGVMCSRGYVLRGEHHLHCAVDGIWLSSVGRPVLPDCE